jgi:beta-aspartyl-peptidase (threonine type)
MQHSFRQFGYLTAILVIGATMELGRAESAEQQNEKSTNTSDSAPLRFAIAIHGGAIGDVSKLTETNRAAAEQALARALDLGKSILEKEGTSLDAVEQVIRFLEDDPTFNAGKGAVFNAAGGHELDASIMEGKTKRCGAVAGVKTVKNPISLARLVMTKTRHVLLAGEGAEKFAAEMKVELVENKYFSTPEKLEELRRAQAAQADPQQHKGTVGCVALDQHGNLAAGTSTGGLTNKMFGRIGDSPIIGAGTYADNATCAVSCTGTGEEFIRNAVAYDLSAQMAYQQVSLATAMERVLTKKLAGGIGGIIAVDRFGKVVMQFNTGGMSRAAADSSGRREIRVGP